jgi:outer membrane receptor protein involved in Fe transport
VALLFNIRARSGEKSFHTRRALLSFSSVRDVAAASSHRAMATPNMRLPSLLHRFAGVGFFVAFAMSAFAAEPAKRNFVLPAGDAAVTLKQFVEQSGEQVVYLVNTVRGVTTQGVAGELTPRAALERMLAGTPLVVVQDAKTGALSVSRVPKRESLPAERQVPGSNRASTRIADSPANEVISLSPFEVRSDATNSYGALQSNSLTAFRMDLAKMPATAQVFTQTFLDDVAATSAQDVLVKYTGLVGADPNNAAAPVNNMPGDRDGSGGGLGIRGLSAGVPKRDGLPGLPTLSRGPTGYNDTFSLERVELIEGPQSLLYGTAGGGGVVNTVSKRPAYDLSRGFVQYRVDQYGGRRAVLDYNRGAKNLAVRIAALGAENNTFRENLGSKVHGLYAAVSVRLGPGANLRIFHELDDARGNVAYNPASSDLNNFFFQKDAGGRIVRDAAGIPIVNPADPRRGQDVRYLALTGQLADLRGALWDGPVDYSHISSFGSWWSSEHIRNNYNGFSLDSKLPWGFSVQLTGVYSETRDERITVGKNLVPPAGYAGAGANPFPETAVRFTPGQNYQSDRTRAFRVNLLHEFNFGRGSFHGRSQTLAGFEIDHQYPTFGNSGIDMLYYQADANWNVVTDPKTTVDYGRIPLSNLYFPIQHGIPSQPYFRPSTGRITVNGVNYVLQPRIRRDASLVSSTNPMGLVPNNPTPANPNGVAGNYNFGGDTHSRLASLANYTEWWDGRLTTVFGASVTRFETINASSSSVTRLPAHDYWGYQYGLNYAFKSWLRAYVTLSTAGQVGGTTKDFYGSPLKVPNAESPAPEVGLKINSPDDRVQAQISYNFSTTVRNEARNAGIDFFNAVNPFGLNGRYNSGDQWINLDRKTTSAELVLSANPTRDWRLRFVAVWLGGEVTKTVSYPQLYNDQFRMNGGTAVYVDGTPIFVTPSTGEVVATGGVPLTLAMINDPTSPLYASPNADSGSITGAALKTALGANPVALIHGGASATGVAGLPISAIQYNWSNPHNGVITVVQNGDLNTGINEYTLNLQSNYVFSKGPLKGFGVFGGVRTFFKNRAYYTTVYPASTSGSAVEGTRMLYRLPNSTVVDLNISYRHNLRGRLRNMVWTTQLNVNNLFDSSEVNVLPSATNAAILNARLTELPRQIIWSNTISF